MQMTSGSQLLPLKPSAFGQYRSNLLHLPCGFDNVTIAYHGYVVVDTQQNNSDFLVKMKKRSNFTVTYYTEVDTSPG